MAIVFLRTLRKWNQARLAAELGISSSAISRWEKGETVPPEKAWDQIVRAVGLPPSWMNRMFVFIHSIRAAVEDPSAAYDPEETLDGIAFLVADRVFEIIRSAAAAILADLPESGGGWWDEEAQEPS